MLKEPCRFEAVDARHLSQKQLVASVVHGAYMLTSINVAIPGDFIYDPAPCTSCS